MVFSESGSGRDPPRALSLGVRPACRRFRAIQESLDEVRLLYESTVRTIAEVIEAGAMRPNIPPEQATDLLLSMRLGIVAAHVGKHRLLPPPERVARLVPEAVALLRAAWDSKNEGPNIGLGLGESVAKEQANVHG